MGNKPSISIIIPTYNEEKVIGTTLQELLTYKQKYHLEIIVVDARSRDSTVRIARRFADRVIVERKRSGIAAGRNKGAFAARGKIIIEMDADSHIAHPDKFFKTIERVFRSPKVVCAMPRFRIHPNEETWEDKFFHALINGAIWAANHFGSFLAKGECQIIRKKAFVAIGGYDENIVVGEDCDLARRLAKIGEVRVVSDIVVYHSPRRFRKEGYVRLIFGTYLREGISLVRKKRSHSKEWVPVR